MAKSVTIPLSAEQYEIISRLAQRDGLEITKLVHKLVRQEASIHGLNYPVPPARGWGKGRARNHEKIKSQVLDMITREMPNCPTEYDEAVSAWRAWSQAVVDTDADVQEVQRVMEVQLKIEKMLKQIN